MEQLSLISLISVILLILLLPIGFLQINKKNRDKNWRLHIGVGKFYIGLSILLAAYQVFYSLFAEIRVFEASGLRIGAFIWLGFLVQAIRFTYKSRFFAHGIWTRRCFVMNIITATTMLLLFFVEEGSTIAVASVWLPLLLGLSAYELREHLNFFRKSSK